MKTVITVGVYDMLHIGHILLFKKAKELGDRLIVAVQDENVILKYKPQAKMIYTTEERCYMVSLSIKMLIRIFQMWILMFLPKVLIRYTKDSRGQSSGVWKMTRRLWLFPVQKAFHPHY